MGLEEVADTRLSATKTIRVIVDDESYEDFTGDDRFFYRAYVNETVWNGPKGITEEERWMYIFCYDTQKTDGEGNYFKRTAAMFPAKAFQYVRTI